ncbi:unnamed protein product [Paramecium primaurelia]|uniref:Uncharacterized protein n=1 Tax=Paramecium primaurelia TaxID=5886 RepID=A0A8S1PKX6_PARPR|nr:unnamed protein product [Paramecium primaurelia]
MEFQYMFKYRINHNQLIVKKVQDRNKQITYQYPQSEANEKLIFCYFFIKYFLQIFYNDFFLRHFISQCWIYYQFTFFINMLTKINKQQLFLRGGGCGMSNTNIDQQSEKNDIQTQVYDFFSKFNHYIQIIESKASVAANQQESSEIMIAIQWFIFQEENIYKINKNVQSVKKSYDLILDGIRRQLISCQTYIRSDSFKCLYILQIKTFLSKVIFSFHLMNDERFMKCEIQIIFWKFVMNYNNKWNYFFSQPKLLLRLLLLIVKTRKKYQKDPQKP